MGDCGGVLGRWLWVLLGLYVALRLLAPCLPIPSTPFTVTLFSLLFVGLSLAVAVRVGVLLRTLRQRLLAALFAAAVFAICEGLVAPNLQGPWLILVVSDTAQIVLAAAVGALLSGVVSEAKIVPALVVTVAVVDVIGLYCGGPVGVLLESRPEIAEGLSQKLPKVGSAVAPPTPGQAPGVSYAATAGIGDFVFVAFLFACIARFGMNYAATFVVTLAAGLLAMLLSLILGAPVPALALLAPSTLCCNLRCFRYTRSEKLALAWGALFLAVLCVLIVFGGELLKPSGQ